MIIAGYGEYYQKETIVFWENIFRETYKDRLDEIQWYSAGSVEDVIKKQDLTVIMTNETNHHYQLKTKEGTPMYISYNLNVKQGFDYNENNYPIHFIAFGIPSFKRAIIIRYKDFKNFWTQYLTQKIRKNKEYITFDEDDLKVAKVPFRVVKLTS